MLRPPVLVLLAASAAASSVLLGISSVLAGRPLAGSPGLSNVPSWSEVPRWRQSRSDGCPSPGNVWDIRCNLQNFEILKLFSVILGSG